MVPEREESPSGFALIYGVMAGLAQEFPDLGLEAVTATCAHCGQFRPVLPCACCRENICEACGAQLCSKFVERESYGSGR